MHDSLQYWFTNMAIADKYVEQFPDFEWVVCTYDDYKAFQDQYIPDLSESAGVESDDYDEETAHFSAQRHEQFRLLKTPGS